MDEIWNQIVSWFEKNVPINKIKWGFNPGATIDNIRNLEKTLGITLPDDYKKLLSIHNGQSYINSLLWLFDGMILMSIEDIIDVWQKRKKFWNNDLYNETQYNNKIRNIVFHKKRITIAEQEGSAMLMLDFIPGSNGKMGQLIFNITECDFIVVGDSITHFLKKYLSLLKSSVFIYDKNYQQVVLANSKKNPYYKNVF